MNSGSISIAMCTRNGAPYVWAQLESIDIQKRPPDELVICDDVSTDNTREVLKAFAVGAGFPVTLCFNDAVLGPIKNFEQAITLCTGDLIILADQDDVWLPNKVRRLEELFSSDQNIGIAFSDAVIVDENLHSLGYNLWDCSVFGEKERQLLLNGRASELLSVRNIVTGATMAFRAMYRDLVLPIPDGLRLMHDGWIALLISRVAGVAFIDEPLVKYRQHRLQFVGARLPHLALKRILEEESLEAWDKRRWDTDSTGEKRLRELVQNRLEGSA